MDNCKNHVYLVNQSGKPIQNDPMKHKILFGFILLFISLISCKEEQKSNGLLVNNIFEFNDAVSNSNSRDVRTLANGVWEYSELVFKN